MGAYIAKIKSNFEADSFFSYTTVKLVVIKDKRLGIIHHILQAAIFIYIVIYTILWQQRYLLLEAPYGSIRATVQQPDFWTDASTLPYCTQNQDSYKYKKYACAYINGTDLQFPPGTADNILIGTRLKDTITNHHHDDVINCTSPPTTIECAPGGGSAQNRYFISDIESYTVYMEHAIFGRQNKMVKSNIDCIGSLKFKNGKHSDITLNKKFRGNYSGDVLPLSTLLLAAGINSLDDPSGLSASYRYDGALIVVVVTYTNDVFNPNALQYTYELFLIPEQDVVAKAPTTIIESQEVQRNWNGVRFIYMVVGSIGYFDFPTLLTSLVNGTVLLNISTMVVDMLILYIMPDKKYYSSHKFQETDAMTKLRKEKERESVRNSATPLLSDDSDGYFYQNAM